MLDNAVKEAKKCTQLLMESVGKKIKAAHDKDETFPQDQGVKMPPLVSKNMYRMARALHFQNADVSEVMLTLKMMEIQLEEADEYRIMARKMTEQLEYYANMPSKNKAFQPTMLRARFQSPYVEYYGFGECNLLLSMLLLYIIFFTTLFTNTQVTINQNLCFEEMKEVIVNLSFWGN